jgi:transcriptional regulator with XRE-family HTH domain
MGASKINDVVARAFGRALRSLRRRKGWSQEQLALQGISRRHVSTLERGNGDPKLGMLWHLAELLEIPPTTLMREIEREYERLSAKHPPKVVNRAFDPKM